MSGISFYTYQVVWFNEAAGEYGENETENGIVCASSYSDAVNRLNEMYGDDNINFLAIECLATETHGVYTTSMDTLERIKEDKNLNTY